MEHTHRQRYTWAIKKCQEWEKYFYPGMSSIVGYPIPLDQPWNHMDTGNTRHNEQVIFMFLDKCIFLFTHTFVYINAYIYICHIYTYIW